MKNHQVKFIVIIILIAPLVSGCSYFIDGEAMAKEVCECSNRADQYKTPNVRQKVLNECVELMVKYEKKLKDNPKELKAYDDHFPCN